MQHPTIDRLKALATMGAGELRSRANAIPELLGAIRELLSHLDGIADEAALGRVSSPEVVALAERIIHMSARTGKSAIVADWNDLLGQAKSLAGSVISQADPSDNDAQAALPLEDVGQRALADARRAGQARKE